MLCRLFLSILVSSITLICCFDLFGDDWASSGPYGAEIRDLAISPGYSSDHTLFAATWAGGVYKSIDGGNSWVQTIENPSRSLAISPNYTNDQTLFSGGTSEDLHKSTDGGISWIELHLPLTSSSLAISPNYTVDKTIFAGSLWNDGIVRSTDGGFSWTAINTGLTDLSIYSLAVSPDFAADQTIFTGTDDGVYKSIDGGSSWVKKLGYNDYPRALVLSSDFPSDQTIFVGFYNFSTYKSTDGGENWRSVGLRGTTALSLSPDYLKDQSVFAGNLDGGVSKSTDGGTNWTPLNSGLPISWVQKIRLSPDFTLDQTLFTGLGVNGDGPGVYRSMNSGNQWQESNNGINIMREIESLAISPTFKNDDTIFAGAIRNDVYKSADGGDSWSMVGSAVGGQLAISPDYDNDQTVFAASHNQYYVHKSTDGGDTWVESGIGIPFSAVWDLEISPAYATDQTIFAGGNGGPFKSTDGGESWVALTNGLPGNCNVREYGISPNYLSDQSIFLGDYNYGVYKTTDGGVSWTAANNGLPSLDFEAIVISPDYPNDQTLFVAIEREGIYRSIDGGATWSQVNQDPYYSCEFAVSPNYAKDQVLFAGCSSSSWRGVLKSTDGGVEWSQISNNGLPEGPSFGDLALSHNYENDQIIWAGIRRGGVFSTTNVGGIPTLSITTDQSVYSIGETMDVSLEAVAGEEPKVANLWIRLFFPGGSPTYYYPAWSTKPSSAVFAWQVTDWGPSVFFSYTFRGTELSGLYIWEAFLIETGLPQLIGKASSTPFTFRP